MLVFYHEFLEYHEFIVMYKDRCDKCLLFFTTNFTNI